MKNTKVFQFNTELHKVTGIQRVLLDIHFALKEDFDVKIVGTMPYDEVNSNLAISPADYVKFCSPLIFHNSIVIIHERRLMPLMWVLTHIPGLNVKCIYVHHNELYGNKRLSLFPKKIVAISDAGIRNLTDYFKVSKATITKIHNCVRESALNNICIRKFNPEDVRILYPARINDVKRQIEIVNYLRGKLDPRVKILFAGVGPLFEELKTLCEGESQFQVLGFRNDIPSLMKDCDFMMLFSQHEGLPISLIEADQVGLPVICNGVGGNTEIVHNGKNGIVVNEWEDLLATLNSLPTFTQERIDEMSREGRAIYERYFKFDIFRDNYRKLINSLINA